MGEDFYRNNDFDFTITGQTGPSNKLCPFTAHIRKTVPRNLDPYIQKRFLESSMVMRTSIAYGPEVRYLGVTSVRCSDVISKVEVGMANETRGLLFICYQSSLEHGFFRQQTVFSAGNNFPITALPSPRHGE
jgi:deferrochelatase/peroxidase EfeB